MPGSGRDQLILGLFANKYPSVCRVLPRYAPYFAPYLAIPPHWLHFASTLPTYKPHWLQKWWCWCSWCSGSSGSSPTVIQSGGVRSLVWPYCLATRLKFSAKFISQRRVTINQQREILLPESNPLTPRLEARTGFQPIWGPLVLLPRQTHPAYHPSHPSRSLQCDGNFKPRSLQHGFIIASGLFCYRRHCCNPACFRLVCSTSCPRLLRPTKCTVMKILMQYNFYRLLYHVLS